MAGSIEEVIGQLTSLKDAVKAEENRREELARDNSNASMELAKTSEAVSERQA